MTEKAKEGTLKVTNGEVKAKKRGRWDQTVDTEVIPKKKTADATWEKDDVTNFIIIIVVINVNLD